MWLQNNFLISICAKFTLTVIYTPGQRIVYNSNKTTKWSARRFILKDDILIEKEVKPRNRDNVLNKQRAFVKLYLLSWIEQGRLYGQGMLNDFYKQFQHLNYKPNHSEVYKGLHKLLENGIIIRSRIIEESTLNWVKFPERN